MSEFDNLFGDENTPEEPKSETETDDTPESIDSENPTSSMPAWLTKKNIAMASIGIITATLLGLFLGGGTQTDFDVSIVYKKAGDVCQRKAEDTGECSSLVQGMKDGEVAEVNGNKITVGGDSITCKSSVCDGLDKLVTDYVCRETSCSLPKDVYMYTLGSEEIAGAPGGGGTREDVRIQSLMFPPTIVTKGFRLEGVEDAFKEEFSVCEEPKGLHQGSKQEGTIGCCSKDCGIGGTSSEYENCIISAGYDHLIYCGTIREDAYARPGESWSRVRAEEIAASFMYYRAAAAAETNEDIPLNRVWVDKAKSASVRAFNWSIFEEVVTASSWKDFVDNKPRYFDETSTSKLKKVFKKAFAKNPERKVCFVLNSADTSNLEYDSSSPLSVALSMPVFATYDNSDAPENLRATPFLNYMQAMASNPDEWARLFFKSSEKSISNRNRNIALEAFKNPFNKMPLRDPASIGDPVEIMKASQSNTPLVFDESSERKTYNIEFKEKQEDYNGYNIHYETLFDDKQLDAKVKDCKANDKCCLFDVAYSKNDGARKPISKVDPSVISLYGGTNKQSCVGPIFREILNNQNIRKKLTEQIDTSLGRPITGLPVCEECRLGGLLPKYLIKAQDPRNNFPSGSPNCSGEVVIGYPSNRQQTLAPIAETLKNELSNAYQGVFTVKVSSLNQTDIQNSAFTILVDEEIFYTMKNAASLYKYKLKDPKKGRTTTPFTDNSKASRCTRCLFQTADALLYGGTPSYSPEEDKECDEYGDFLKEQCGIDEEYLVSYDTLLPKLEEYYQRYAQNPILHLYYFAPLRIVTEGSVQGGSCGDALENIINKR